MSAHESGCVVCLWKKEIDKRKESMNRSIGRLDGQIKDLFRIRR